MVRRSFHFPPPSAPFVLTTLSSTLINLFSCQILHKIDMNDPQILFPYHRGCQEAILLIMEHRGKTPIPLSSPNSIYLSYKLQTTSLNNLRKYTYCVSFKYTLLSITMPPTQDYHGHYKFRICTAHRPGKHMGVFWK